MDPLWGSTCELIQFDDGSLMGRGEGGSSLHTARTLKRVHDPAIHIKRAADDKAGPRLNIWCPSKCAARRRAGLNTVDINHHRRFIDISSYHDVQSLTGLHRVVAPEARGAF